MPPEKKVLLPEGNYDRVAHLGFIQGAINRMAGNCFLCKGWAITLFVALMSLDKGFSDSEILRCLTLLIMVLVFWCLDSYYLQLERLFRVLYDDVRRGIVEEPYSMGCKPFEWKRMLQTMFSLSEWPVYFLLLLFPITKALVIYCSIKTLKT